MKIEFIHFRMYIGEVIKLNPSTYAGKPISATGKGSCPRDSADARRTGVFRSPAIVCAHIVLQAYAIIAGTPLQSPRSMFDYVHSFITPPPPLPRLAGNQV